MILRYLTEDFATYFSSAPTIIVGIGSYFLSCKLWPLLCDQSVYNKHKRCSIVNTRNELKWTWDFSMNISEQILGKGIGGSKPFIKIFGDIFI